MSEYKNKTINSVEMLEYTINEAGARLLTVKVTCPAFTWIHLLVHRSFTKNGISKRAVKGGVQISKAFSDGFVPLQFFRDQKAGMQPNQLYPTAWQIFLTVLWKMFTFTLVMFAWMFHKLGVTRQIIGGMLMPIQKVTRIITMPDYGAENFFKLRCGAETGTQNETSELAFLIKNVYDNYEPRLLKKGEWHIPYSTENLSTEQNIYKSVACTAFVSYDTAEKQRPMKQYKRMYKKLLAVQHMSCFQHIALSTGDTEFSESFRGFSSLREILKKEGKVT